MNQSIEVSFAPAQAGAVKAQISAKVTSTKETCRELQIVFLPPNQFI
jgi:hypothetical protein